MSVDGTFDVVVVGGGIVGANVAWWARKQWPSASVGLVEAGSIGGGATAFSAGLSFPLARTVAQADLVRVSHDGYKALRAGGLEQHFRPIRLLCVLRAARVEAFRRTVCDGALEAATTTDLEWLGRRHSDLKLASDEIVCVLSPVFRVDASRLTRALVRDSSVEVCRTRVEWVEPRPSGWRLRASSTTIDTRLLAMCTGPWSEPSEPSHADVRTKRVVALHAADQPVEEDRAVYFVEDDLFWLPEPQLGYSLVSFYRNVWDERPEAMDGTPTAADIDAGRQVIARRSVAMAERCHGGRAFCDAYTPERLPVVRSVHSSGGAVTATGGSGSGVRLAPGMGRAAVTLLASAEGQK